MRDACDPESFGAVGVTCIRKGGITLDRFLELLGKQQTVASWAFFPARLEANVGQTLLALNQGGEVHTFTQVASFGGGLNDLLNQLSGNPTPAPECQNLPADAFIAPGASQIAEVGAPGTKHYQCCIHPWMRLDLRTQ
jgi:plastocyanin